jgi:hypothetical protein
MARLTNVIDAIADELARQCIAYMHLNDAFDVAALGEAVLKAADGTVIRFLSADEHRWAAA